MVTMLVIVLLGAVKLLHLPARGDPVAGPYRVVPERFEECPPEMVDVPFKLKMRAVRDRHNVDMYYVFANMTTGAPYDDSLTYGIEFVPLAAQGVLDFASWSSRGGWKEHAYHMAFKRVCTACRTYIPKLWRLIMKGLFQDPNRQCPILPGYYHAHNVTTKLDRVASIPVFFYGKYRVDAHTEHTESGRRTSCFRIYGSIVPKYN